MSPLDSARAFLHSIMPTPVRSRRSFTSEAVIVIGYSFLTLDGGIRAGEARELRARDRVGKRRHVGPALRRRGHAGALLRLLAGAQERVAHEAGEEADRADRVVVPRQRIVHHVRVAI